MNLEFDMLYERALHAVRLGEPREAERQLRAIQAAHPGEVNSLRLLGLALLAQHKGAEAVAVLQQAVDAAPDFPHARADLARALLQAGRIADAYAAIRAAIEGAPTLSPSWLAYGDVLVEMGRYFDAGAAFHRAQALDPHAARLSKARSDFAAGRPQEAERVFRDVLERDPGHMAALCGLAAASLHAGKRLDAERLLERALTHSAHAPLIWRVMSETLLDAGRLPEAEAAIRRTLQVEPRNVPSWVALGAINSRLMKPEAALAAFEEADRLDPAYPLAHLSVGHVLKILGRRAECESTYRECIERGRDAAEAYWSLADLKNYSFSDVEIAGMESLLASSVADAAKTALLHFSLGRAREQRGAHADAFAHYAAGNSLRRLSAPFDLRAFREKSRRVIRRLDREFFAANQGSGCADPAPIFIVGLPRSGSTLLEQILASHSAVEGTTELPNILNYVRELDGLDAGCDAYPDSLHAAPRAVLAALGRRYLEETRPLRGAKPRFIDKLPNNFSHVGFIHAILPNAAVIDMRRHPMDTCFSCYKQHFAAGQTFSYDLDMLGGYYGCYRETMDHWDAVLPGKVLRVSYEQLVREPETHIRRALAHCGLDFEPACLQFHQTVRPVRTASSEQVRPAAVHLEHRSLGTLRL